MLFIHLLKITGLRHVMFYSWGLFYVHNCLYSLNTFYLQPHHLSNRNISKPFLSYILFKHMFHFHLLGRKSAQQGLGASRLPVFTAQEKSYIRGTCDFLGIGHFTTRYITQKNYPSGRGNSYFTDRDLAELVDPRWPDPGSEWLYSVPWGFRRLLNFVKVN